jgi:tetratricopeptide (TPR) repeat protein
MFKGGAMIDLYFKKTNTTGIPALLALSKRMKLTIDPGLQAKLNGTILDDAKAAVEAGQLERGSQLIAQALEREPRNPHLLRLAALVDEKTGRLQEAEDGYLRAARCAVSQKDLDFALEVLRADGTRLQPRNPALRVAIAEVLERNGAAEEARTERLAVCDLLESLGRTKECVTLLETVFEQRPTAGLSHRLGDMFQKLGDPERALVQYEDASVRYTQQADPEGEREVLAKFCDLAPTRWPERRRLAELLAFEDPIKGAREYASMATTAMECGDLEIAKESVEKALATEADNLAAIEAQGEVLLRLGRPEEAVPWLLRAADLYRTMEMDSEVDRLLETARRVAPQSLDVSISVARTALAEGNLREARDLYAAAAHRLNAEGRNKEALELARELSGHASESFTIAEASARLADESGSKDEAGRMLAKFADRLLSVSPKKALQAAQRGLEFLPGDESLQRLVFDANLAEGNLEFAVDAAKNVAGTSHSPEMLARAEDALRALLEHRPNDLRLLELLGGVFRAQDRRREAAAVYRKCAESTDSKDVETRTRFVQWQIEMYPEDSAGALQLADLYISTNRLAEAETLLVRVAEVHSEAREWSEAIEVLERAMALPSPALTTLRRTADFQFEHGDVYRAQDLFDQLLNRVLESKDAALIEDTHRHVFRRDPTRREALVALAKWQAGEGMKDAALATLSDVEIAAGEAGDTAAVESAIRARIDIAPGDPSPRRALGERLLALGDSPGGIEQLLHASSLYRSDRANDSAACLELVLGADPTIRPALERLPDLIPKTETRRAAKALRNRALARSGDSPKDATKDFEHAVTLEPSDRSIREEFAAHLIATNALPRASDQYDAIAALAHEAKEVEAEIAALRSAIEATPSKRNLHERLIQALRSEHPEDYVKESLVLADLCDEEKDEAGAAKILAGLSREFPDNEELLARAAKRAGPVEGLALLLSAARRAFESGNHARTVLLGDQALLIDAGSKDVLALLADAHEALGDHASARMHLLTLAAIEPLSEASLELLKRAERIGTPDSAVTRLLAERLFAADKSVEGANVALRYAEVQSSAGNHAEAASLLAHAIGFAPGDIRLFESRARIFDALGNTSGSVEAWLAAGELHRAAGDFAEALRCADLAVEIAPSNLVARRAFLHAVESSGDIFRAVDESLRFADFLVTSGDQAAADEFLKGKFEASPTTEKYAQAFASSLVTRGEVAAAADVFAKHAEALEEAGDPDAAELALKRASETEAASAPRVLAHAAALTRLRRNEDAFLEALRAIELSASAKDDASFTEALRQCGWLRRELPLGAVATQARILNSVGKVEDAVALFVESIKESEDKDEELELAKSAALLLPKNPDAIELLVAAQRSKAAWPAYIAAVIEFASACDEANDSPRGTAAIVEGLKQHPDAMEFHRALVARHEAADPQSKEDLAKALADYSAAATRQGDRVSARDAGRRLLNLKPDDLDAARRMAEFCIADGAPHEAAALLVDLGERLEKSDQVIRAIAEFEHALRLDAACEQAMVALVRIARTRDHTESFLAATEQYAQFLSREDRQDEAAKLLAEASDRAPDNIAAAERWQTACERAGDEVSLTTSALRVARLARTKGLATTLRQAVARLEMLAPEDRHVLREMGELLLHVGERERAMRFLTLAAEKFQILNELAPALALCDQIVEFEPNNPALRTMRSVLLEGLGRTEEAADEVAELVNVRVTEGRSVEAIEELRRLLTLSPLRTAAREQLADLLVRTGDEESACAEFELIAADKERQGELDAALKAVQRAAKYAPDSPAIRHRLASLQEALGDHTRARIEHQWLAKHYADLRSFATATTHAEKAAELAPQNGEALLDLAELLKLSGDKTRSIEVLAKASEIAAASGDEKLALRALVLARDGAPDDLDLHRKVAAMRAASGDLQGALDERLEIFRLEIEAGHIERAQELVAEIVEKVGPDASLRRRIAQAYVQSGIPELAVVEYAEAARIHLDSGDAKSALEAARQARDLRPTDPASRRAEIDALIALKKTDSAFDCQLELGAYHADREKFDLAINVYREAVDLHPDDPLPRQRLTAIFEQLGRSEDLVLELRVLSEVYEKAGNHADTINALKRLLAVRPDDTRARIRYIDSYRHVGPEIDLVDDYFKLAEIHARHGAVHEAERVFERLLSLSPERTDAREKFIDFLFKHSDQSKAVSESYLLATEFVASRKFREAQTVLTRIESVVGEDPEFFLLQGRIHEGTNARGMALRDLHRAADLFKAKNETERWRETLRQILRVDPYNVDAPEELIRHLEAAGEIEEALAVILQLADGYESRQLLDFAEGEYRRALRLKPDADDIWKKLLSVRVRIATPAEVAVEYLALGDSLLARGRQGEALEQFSEAVQADPMNIDARLRYVKTYLKVGRDRDIADDIISLGDLLSSVGRVDEALEWYGRLVALDPGNTNVREKMSATQARRMHEAAGTATDPGSLKHKPPASIPKRPIDTDLDLSNSQVKILSAGRDPSATDASGFLSSALTRLEEEEQQAAITQVINNYRDILSVNAQNATVRVKLADVLEQVGDLDGAMRELITASEIYFTKGDLNSCVGVCERILQRNPRDQKVRDRLLKAINKRDAFKAIESAILFSDQPHPDRDTDSRY